ncbi:hypothetical protein ACFWN7_13150 [Agromyces sp. NPDC058484]|uniref:hypothetical protein n=1 Tax=Agromyces sp. NPDC058484 TaxID=3346524 RepID=UPI0036611415
MDIIIENPTELHTLTNRRARRGVERVTLVIPGAEEEALRRTERAINRGLHACGCETGAVFLVAGAVLLAGRALLDPNQMEWASPPTWWGAGLVLFTATLLGKMVGLVWAEWQFRAAINRFPEVTDSEH